MKPNSFLNRTRGLVALGMSAGLLLALPSNAGTKTAWPLENALDKKKPGEEDPKKAKTTTKSTTSSLNNDVVKIYPDMVKRSMHVITKENNGANLDFFVFDLNGVIIQHFKMKEKDHIKISGLAKGKYVYRVFAGDNETASGHFEIR